MSSATEHPLQETSAAGQRATSVSDAVGPSPAPCAALAADLDECTLSLLLWAVAKQLKPPAGWFRATGFSEESLLQLAKERGAATARLRVLLAVGRLLEGDDLSVLLKARLTGQLLTAVSVKDLAEAARVIERAGAALQAQAASATSERGESSYEEAAEADLDAAIAEVRRLLAELERLPTPEQLVAATEAALAASAPDDAADPAGDAE